MLFYTMCFICNALTGTQRIFIYKVLVCKQITWKSHTSEVMWFTISEWQIINYFLVFFLKHNAQGHRFLRFFFLEPLFVLCTCHKTHGDIFHIACAKYAFVLVLPSEKIRMRNVCPKIKTTSVLYKYFLTLLFLLLTVNGQWMVLLLGSQWIPFGLHQYSSIR